ncbi:hypothetical protein BL253_16925 [Pseudofrankia asymbiotica]|uniref:Uncharacterized protein n=1 Tax=Pseudofrankia asymbiotica TaxID=1834516 RepID=A0A1V2IC06_9ACTN|nr:hypothetical protein BL253_16925 [Pseudofrankia asymbiotica]
MQGQFGVCAMTTAVRELLKHDRATFIALMDTLYLRLPFRGIAPPPTMIADLTGQAATKIPPGRPDTVDFMLARVLGMLFKVADEPTYNAQIAFSRRWNPNFGKATGSALDVFDLEARLLPDLKTAVVNSAPRLATQAAWLAGTAPAWAATPFPPALEEELKRKQYWLQQACGFGIDVVDVVVAETVPNKQWTITFKYDGAPRTLTVTAGGGPYDPLKVTAAVAGAVYEQGHLAVDVDGMLVLLKKIIGFAEAQARGSWKVEGEIGAVNTTLTAGGSSLVYAGTTASTELLQAKRAAAVARTGGHPYTVTRFMGDPAPRPAYYGMATPEPTHWVALTGPIVDAGTHWGLPLWSWRENFTVEIEKGHLGNWVYRWITGRVN